MNGETSTYNRIQRAEAIEHEWAKGNHVRTSRAISIIGDVFHWSCGTSTDEELHVLTANEETVNNHFNAVQQLIRADHTDLANTATTLQGYTTKVTNVLQQVLTAVQNFLNSIF